MTKTKASQVDFTTTDKFQWWKGKLCAQDRREGTLIPKENCKAPFWQQHTSLEHKHSLQRHNTIIKVKKGSSGFQDYAVLSPTM
jgi:hypothetical protein